MICASAVEFAVMCAKFSLLLFAFSQRKVNSHYVSHFCHCLRKNVDTVIRVSTLNRLVEQTTESSSNSSSSSSLGDLVR